MHHDNAYPIIERVHAWGARQCLNRLEAKGLLCGHGFAGTRLGQLGGYPEKPELCAALVQVVPGPPDISLCQQISFIP